MSDEKRVWFEGRGVWVYSFLYNHLAREQKYLDTAAASVRLLARNKTHDPEEFWPKTLHRDGSPAGPPDTEVYSDLFVAEGLAGFSRASGDRKHWDEARTILLKCVRRYDKPDYHPQIGQTYLGPSAPCISGGSCAGSLDGPVTRNDPDARASETMRNCRRSLIAVLMPFSIIITILVLD